MLLRRTVNLAAAISLMLCIATIVVRIIGHPIELKRGSWDGTFVNWFGGLSYVKFNSYPPGQISISVAPADSARVEAWEAKLNRYGSVLGFLWLRDCSFTEDGDANQRVVWAIGDVAVFQIPAWFVAGFFAVLPIAWLRARRHWRPVGHCRSCSYNLTGNTSGVCPECGNPIGSRNKGYS